MWRLFSLFLILILVVISGVMYGCISSSGGVLWQFGFDILVLDKDSKSGVSNVKVLFNMKSKHDIPAEYWSSIFDRIIPPPAVPGTPIFYVKDEEYTMIERYTDTYGYTYSGEFHLDPSLEYYDEVIKSVIFIVVEDPSGVYKSVRADLGELDTMSDKEVVIITSNSVYTNEVPAAGFFVIYTEKR